MTEVPEASDHLSYVFGYGSLMEPASVAETIDYNLDEYPLLPALLNGYQRSFSAISPNSRPFTTQTGDAPEFVAYMNVRPVPGATAYGVLLTVDDQQLRKLKQREVLYRCIDVTANVQLPAGATYTLRPELAVLTFECLQQHRWEDYDKRTAFGEDYERTIRKAHERIDNELGTTAFTDDWQQLLQRYAHWPRVTVSNSRNADGYPDSSRK